MTIAGVLGYIADCMSETPLHRDFHQAIAIPPDEKGG